MKQFQHVEIATQEIGIKVTTAATKELITQKCSECHKKAREHFDKSVHSLDYVDKEKRADAQRA